MVSIRLVKGVWRKGLAAVILAAALSATPAKAVVIAGGTVPLDNYFLAFGNTGLSVGGAAAVAVSIANIYVWNNSAGGWTLTLTARNGGFARLGQIAGGVAGSVNHFVTLTYELGALLAAPASAIGAGGTVFPAATTFLTPTVAGATVTHTSAAQTTATVAYPCLIKGTWVADATLLAGFYSEEFTVTLSAVL